MKAVIRIYKTTENKYLIVTALPLDWIKKFEGAPATMVCGVRLHPFWGSQQNGNYRLHTSRPYDRLIMAKRSQRLILGEIAFAQDVLLEWFPKSMFLETLVEL